MQPYIVDKVVNPTNKQVIMENQPKEIGNPIKRDSGQGKKLNGARYYVFKRNWQ